MTPEILLFDIGNVILPLRLDRFQAAVDRAVPGSPADSWNRLYLDPASDAFERGAIGRGAFRQAAARVLGAIFGPAEFEELYCALFDGTTSGLEGALGGLAGRYRLALLSNTNAIHADYFISRHGELFDRFEPEARFYSHELGLRKPEEAIFREVLRRLGAPAEKVRFFDDSPANVASASRLGIDAVLIPSPAAILGELQRL
ncbi:MAG: HAD-IA family hydrolase [Spirochaetes bacterium]|nr:HAD-IA family hydrolase [Spirochaetota bacterium]